MNISWLVYGNWHTAAALGRGTLDRISGRASNELTIFYNHARTLIEKSLREAYRHEAMRQVWMLDMLTPPSFKPKLPARAPLHRRLAPLTWAAAAVLLMAVGAGAFWAGRANRAPLVEAALPRSAEPVEAATSVSDTPFHDREEDAAQVQSLSPDELKALLGL